MNSDEIRYYREPDGSLLKLDIGYDENPLNPRTDWDNVGTMVCFHRRYTLGDMQTRPDGRTSVIPHTNVRYDNSADGAESFVEWAKERLARNELVIASLELYDHGGITIHVRDWGEEAFGTGRTGWDSGVIGWIFVTKETAFAEYGGLTEKDWKVKAQEYLADEVKTYDDYLTGEVYQYALYRLSAYRIIEHGVEKIQFNRGATWDLEDSCGGYFGYDHKKSGLLACLPLDAVRVYKADLPDVAKEAA